MYNFIEQPDNELEERNADLKVKVVLHVLEHSFGITPTTHTCEEALQFETERIAIKEELIRRHTSKEAE